MSALSSCSLLLWRQRGLVARTSFSSFRWFSSSSDGDDEIAKARKEADLAELRCKLAEHRSKERIAEAEAAAREANLKAESAAHADNLKAEAAAREANLKAEAAAREANLKAESAAHADNLKAEAAAREANLKAEAAAREANLKAEAAAHADKVKSEADKAKAEADSARAGADSARAGADSARAGADSARAGADSARAGAGSAWAEAGSARDRLWAQRTALLLSTGALVLCAAYLAYDEVTHSRAFVRWYMKRVISAGPADSLLPEVVPEDRLFVLQDPEVDHGTPLLILGPSGSGKSSLMAKMVRDLKAKKVPVAYFSTRSAYEEKDGEPLSGAPALELASRKFCVAVGYPERPSLLSQWKAKDASLGMPSGLKASVIHETGPTVKHFRNAIDELFEACSELRDETGKVPYIIVDEFHDFMSERLRWAGGEALFVIFANHMLKFCLDRARVEVVAGASGSALLSDLERMTKAKDDRVDTFYTEDPTEAAVRTRLLKLTYSDAVATRIIDSCGTRLRILKPFLIRGKAMPEADVERKLNKAGKRAEQSIKSLLRRAEEAGVKKELVAIFRKLDKGEKVDDGDVPRALRSPFPNNILYWAEGGVVTFQSVPVKTAWKELR
jgi:energy-coupling factor transporter ATP-binding protein EcfA2